MKGTVVSTWMKTCRKIYGDSIIQKAMSSVGWEENKIFSPIENVDDDTVKNVIKRIAEQINMSTSELWKIIGKDNILSFHADFPSFFKQPNMYSFLRSLFDIHVVMTKKFTGAHPPLVSIKPVSSTEAVFTYQSKRGMFDYFYGLLEGCIDFYKEDVKVQELERKSDYLAVKLTFSQNIYYHKSYFFSKLLSFGFIKSIPLKASIFTALCNLLLFTPVMGLDLWYKSFTLALGSSLFTFLSLSLLLRPKKDLEEELEKLIQNDYLSDIKISSHDFF